MNIDRVITQLKLCPTFAGRVAGSANYSEGLETVVSLTMPAAYVYPLADEVSENENMGWGLRQLVQERIAVVVVIDNTADRRGQAAVDTIETLKYAIFAALLNWNPSGMPRANQGLRYGGGSLLSMDRARLFWQFEFVLAATINEDDGFTVAGTPLTQIMIDPHKPPLEVGIHLIGG